MRGFAYFALAPGAVFFVSIVAITALLGDCEAHAGSVLQQP
jgi:hypothetical protein